MGLLLSLLRSLAALTVIVNLPFTIILIVKDSKKIQPNFIRAFIERDER